MTWSTPMDKDLQALCKHAAKHRLKCNNNLTANKRLDFEIMRLKNCGELMKKASCSTPRVLISKSALMW